MNFDIIISISIVPIVVLLIKIVWNNKTRISKMFHSDKYRDRIKRKLQRRLHKWCTRWMEFQLQNINIQQIKDDDLDGLFKFLQEVIHIAKRGDKHSLPV